MADRRLGSLVAIVAVVGGLTLVWWFDRGDQQLRRVEAPAAVAALPPIELAWIADADERAAVAAVATAIDRRRAQGVAFADPDRRLPPRPAGYWRAYVVPGGPRTVVAGERHEIYYSRDDRQSFTALRGATP